MGAWGAGAFENDEAADWIAETGGTRDAIVRALERASRPPDTAPLDASTADVAVAAIALVVEAKGRAADGGDPRLEDGTTLEPEVLDQALRLLPAIRSSESAELWGGDEDWCGMLDGYGRVLRGEVAAEGGASSSGTTRASLKAELMEFASATAKEMKKHRAAGDEREFRLAYADFMLRMMDASGARESDPVKKVDETREQLADDDRFMADIWDLGGPRGGGYAMFLRMLVEEL